MDKIITYSLSDNFIKRLAEYLEDNFYQQGKDISRVAVVFGGKRPALFLKRELASRIKKSFFPPRFFSIDDFVEYTLSKKEPFSKISDLDACFVIYQIAKGISSDILKGRQSFSEFLPWAREILAFIEQLDLEEIGSQALKNIQSKASIGYDVPESINLLLAKVISLREEYHLRLKGKKAYSRGLSYLLAAEYSRECGFAEFEQVIFCGFFYLHKTEQKIMRRLYDNDKGIFIFQGDRRDWSVLEGISKDFSFPIKPQVQEKEREQRLIIQRGFDAHSQAGLVREALKKISKIDDTVVLLPNPNNLMPLLSEVFASAGDFNVSMGYPLKRSALYSLLECIFKAQTSKKGAKYYAKDYLAAITHPIIKNLKVSLNPSVTRVLAHKIEEIFLGIEKAEISGSLFFSLSEVQNSPQLIDMVMLTLKKMDIEVSWDELRQALIELHNILFIFWEKADNFYDFSLSLDKFLEVLVKKSSLGSYHLNIKMAEKIYAIKDELSGSLFSREQFPAEEIFKIFKNKLENEMVSFSGSPLKGLQILGVFEARSLSFENVIIMDVNESILPNLKIYEPLIPREVMIGLGLGRLEKEEEIQRYQFRRLISCAKNVYLIYQQTNDRERSRFIEELIWEKEKESGGLGIFSIPGASFQVEVLPKRIKIRKNAKIIKFLEGHTYSASSVNTYLHCPLRFYYQYVLGLMEKESLLDELEGADIGTFIHELLEKAFAKFVGGKPRIDQKFERDFFAALDKKFSEEFERKMKSDSFLVKAMLDFRMQRFLENEREREVEEVLCLEQVFEKKILLKSRDFKFKAVIDRIDRISAKEILVLDYKTGSLEAMPQEIEKIQAGGFSRKALKNTLRSFQLPIYLNFADSQKKYSSFSTNAALYSLKNMEKNFGLHMLFSRKDQLMNKEKAMAVYLGALDALLQEILDPNTPFTADEQDNRPCQFCPFIYLCR